MKLTNSIRESVVNAVMGDIPKIDYNEKINKIVQEEVIKQAPKSIQDAYNDSKAKEYLSKHYISVNSIGSYCVYGLRQSHDSLKFSEDAIAEIEKLRELFKKQNELRNKAEQDLRALLASVTTTDNLIRIAPDLESYIPKPAEKTDNLPAVQNVMASLRETGWTLNKATA